MASSGTSSGMPLSVDVGANVFGVNVKDSTGLTASGVMNLNMAGAPPITVFASAQGTDLLLTWTGGIAPT